MGGRHAGELWESGRGTWSAGSGKAPRGLSDIYTYVHRYDVIKWTGKVKRFFEHPRMSGRRARRGAGGAMSAVGFCDVFHAREGGREH